MKLSKPNESSYHEKLLPALYWIWDGFDRAMMGMFPVYSTALSIISNKDLEGDGIHVGTRQLEWKSGSKPILDAFLGEPVDKSETFVKYIHNDIPVFIHIFEDDPCIQSTNQVFYENEYFKLPNPYSRFIKRFEEWKSQ